MKSLAGLALLLSSSVNAVAAQPKLILACPQIDGTQIRLLAEPASDGSRYYLEIGGRVDKAFTDMPDADFIGEIVLSKCIRHVLVFAIEYGPPYRKGVAVRKRLTGPGVDRIDFSEKALPLWLYVNSTELKVLIPNYGNEVASRYLLYTFSAAQGQPGAPAAVDTEPVKRGFEAVRIDGH